MRIKKGISFLLIALLLLMMTIMFTVMKTDKKKMTSHVSVADSTKTSTVELTMAYMVSGGMPSDVKLVEEALNRIVTPRIQVRIKLLPINFGAAQQQYNLMLSSGEKLDLLMTMPATYTTLVSQMKLQEIGKLIDRYGAGIKNALGRYYEAGKINGKIYGVRPVADMGSGGGLVIRKDIVKKYRINLKKIKSLADIEKVLHTIKSHEPNTFPLCFSNQNIGIAASLMTFTIDNLGDNFGVLTDYGQKLKVVNLFESKQYLATLRTLRNWYQKGYIIKDIATNKESQHTLLAYGKAYAYITATKPDIAAQESSQNGYECVVSEFSPAFSSSFNGTLFDWVVPNACDRPDKAVQMLNLMYTDPRVENLLAWGVEGKHYERKASGTIGFPKGVNAQNSGYFIQEPWLVGNEYLLHVWEGNPTNLWEQVEAFNNKMILSKAIGFAYDPSPVRTELAAVSYIYDKYRMGLENGTADIDLVYPKFITKLKEAGIDRIIAEKQKQLNAWAAKNHIK